MTIAMMRKKQRGMWLLQMQNQTNKYFPEDEMAYWGGKAT